MTYRKYEVTTVINPKPGSTKQTKLDYELSSGNSPKVNGKLKLQNNGLNFRKDSLLRVISYPTRDGVFWAPVLGASITRDYRMPTYGAKPFDLGPMRNKIRAKFDGKLRYGSASMGVTLASWNQSQAMIVKRMGTAQRSLDRTYMRLSRDRRLLGHLRKEKEPLANQILEVEFGWMPLMQDIKAAFTTVVQHAIPDSQVVSRANAVYMPSAWVSNNPGYWYQWNGLAKGTYSARVRISNPNLWLANRMGLINLPGVAWDLVPWSFVVNMFGNFNQLISSLTSEVGLTIDNRCYTESVRMLTQLDTYVTQGGSTAKATHHFLWTNKVRTLEAQPPLSLQFKTPELNWELAVIASSLVVQRFAKINRLIGFTRE